jgi:membrane-associated phospholipid phosphatase
MHFLENIDQQLFFFINHSLHIGFLDTLMPYWRSMYLWLPLYMFFIAYLILNHGKKGGYLILALLLTVGVADITSSRIVKKTVERLRPCNDGDIKDKVKLLVRCGGGYSFTSSHATNHFAVAIFLFFACFYNNKRLKWALIAWAASIGFGQIYVGVHYPFDILCGAILGSAIGYFGYRVVKKHFGELIDDMQK